MKVHRVLPHTEILSVLWPADDTHAPDEVYHQIYWIRQAVEPDPTHSSRIAAQATSSAPAIQEPPEIDGMEPSILQVASLGLLVNNDRSLSALYRSL